MPARRVHSRYMRTPANTAVGGQPTVIDLQVRRFFCDNSDCRKKTFAEQVEGLTFRYGRRTVLLQRALEQVALILGGAAGERLAARLSMPVSGSTLLRLIRRLELPAASRTLATGRKGHPSPARSTCAQSRPGKRTRSDGPRARFR